MLEHTIDTIPVNALFAPAVVYPVYRLDKKAGESVTAAEISTLEEQMGTGVQAGEIALFAHGWDRYWDKNDETLFSALNVPGLTGDAGRLLMERGIRALGSDTMKKPTRDGSLTIVNSTPFAVS